MKIAFLLLGFSLPAVASSFLEIPFENSVSDSPVILRGTVGKSEVQRITLSNGSTMPFTYWDLKVSEVLKGDLKERQIRVRQLGGEKDGSGMAVSGAAEFKPGEEVMLMLEEPAAEDASFPIRGLGTGKYAIDRDEKGNEYVIGAGIGPEADDPSGTRRLSLREVRRMVTSRKEAGKSPSVTSSGTPSGGALLGERAGSPVPVVVASLTPSQESPVSSKESPRGRLWVFLVGGAIGIWFYRRRMRR